MPNSKPFDLGFYKGFNKDNRILFSQQLLNAIPWESSVYPFPEFIPDLGFPTVDVSVDGTQISKKIQNNNLILASGAPAEALLMIGIPSLSTNQITVDTQVAHKNVGGEGTYGFFDFSFTYTGRAKIGTIQGLTAFGITLSEAAFGGTDTFYVGFVGAVASYNFLGPNPPTEGSLVSLSQLQIVDITVDVSTELLYVITANEFYSLNFGTEVLTLIDLKGCSTAVNFLSVATDDVYVYIAGTDNDEATIVIYEIATGNCITTNPFNNKAIPLTRIIFERGIGAFNGTKRPLSICTNGEGVSMSEGWNGTTFPNRLTVSTAGHPTLSSDVITDVSQIVSSKTPDYTGIILTSSTGINLGYQNGGTITIGNVPILDMASFLRGQLITNSMEEVLAVVKGDFTILATQQDPKFFAFVVVDAGISNGTIVAQGALVNFSRAALTLGVSTQRNNSGASAINEYWLGTTGGVGVVRGRGQTASPDFATISDTYELRLQDIIKTDIFTYFFLVDEIGSSTIDANSILIEYQSDQDIIHAGIPGYFLPSDKFWVAGDVFILRNLETQSSFYYKTFGNLDLNELSGVSSASQDEGLVNTTEAGNMVDLIYTKSLFYLLGTRGIEVWQNQGASGFPFRKESYLTIPYHLLPLSDQNLYRIELNRWAYFNGGYAVSVLSNEDNEYQILLLQGGKYSLFPLNKAAWYAALNQVGTPSPDDLTLDVVNLWGKEYIIISKINSRTVGTRSAAFIMSEKGQISALPGDSVTQLQYFTTTSTNGMQTLYDDTGKTFQIEVAPQFPITVPIGVFTFQSQLLKEFAENVLVQSVIIQYDFPIQDLVNYPPAATFSMAWSADEGRSFTNNIISGELWSNHITTRQLVYTINTSVPSFMLQFTSTSPIIIQSAIVLYQPTGLRVS